ncbi:MAG: hypothetical protein MK345_02880 [SAR202 cluster bacterium]|nr:hypothetical protein [SAR202 cluster bacterium]|tara:strand:+ start:9088 stop:9453 length:366 start_codon:yes stop_codon:yes gene_type:complete
MEIPLSITELFLIIIITAFLVSLVFLYFFSKVIVSYKRQLRSQSVKFGQISEQFIPLHKVFPWDSKQFRFLGSPIDGIQFEEDQIILLEFKSGNSDLSTKQRKIRNLVENGKVDFQVIRVK